MQIMAVAQHQGCLWISARSAIICSNSIQKLLLKSVRDEMWWASVGNLFPEIKIREDPNTLPETNMAPKNGGFQ